MRAMGRDLLRRVLTGLGIWEANLGNAIGNREAAFPAERPCSTARTSHGKPEFLLEPTPTGGIWNSPLSNWLPTDE
jgi:hypothetical protein